MAEMEYDDFSAGIKRINMEHFSGEALEAASRAGGRFIEQQSKSDCAAWSAEQWDRFIWEILSAGIYEADRLTKLRIDEMTRSADEIPY